MLREPSKVLRTPWDAHIVQRLRLLQSHRVDHTKDPFSEGLVSPQDEYLIPEYDMPSRRGLGSAAQDSLELHLDLLKHVYHCEGDSLSFERRTFNWDKSNEFYVSELRLLVFYHG